MDMSVNASNLNNVMDFEHVIRVHSDGSVSDGIDGVWAPECHIDSDLPFGEAGSATHPHIDSPWVLMGGYSGQHGYSGPVMHSSELIGGAIAEDILSEPGLYVAVVVSDLSADSSADSDAGWAIARRDL